jgi:hypothetical protein
MSESYSKDQPYYPDDGGAAFPNIPPCDANGHPAIGYSHLELGMTLRDWFAGQALNGV